MFFIFRGVSQLLIILIENLLECVVKVVFDTHFCGGVVIVRSSGD